MREWQLWKRGRRIKHIRGIKPLLASWEKSNHPSQVRLRDYLESLVREIGPLPDCEEGLYLHLHVDVGEQDRLLRHYDLENYLTPLFSRHGLDSTRFEYVSAEKTVGSGSHLEIGVTAPRDAAELEQWEFFECRAGRGTSSKTWKQRIHDGLAIAGKPSAADGPIRVHLAWRCSPIRNWINLWKPTGDAMGPVLGYADHRNPFNPSDDRIVWLGLHRNVDCGTGFDVDVAMWWWPSMRSCANER